MDTGDGNMKQNTECKPRYLRFFMLSLEKPYQDIVNAISISTARRAW